MKTKSDRDRDTKKNDVDDGGKGSAKGELRQLP